MRRIICIGNAFAGLDSAGAEVFGRLSRERLPEDVEVVDGGLRGIDLLGLVERSERVVFVDSLSGWGPPGSVQVLDAVDLQEAPAGAYEHAAGFVYLLRSLPYLVQRPVPVWVVGLEAPASPAAVDEAARLALAFASSPDPVRAQAVPAGQGR